MQVVDVRTLLLSAPQSANYWGAEAWRKDGNGPQPAPETTNLSATFPLRWRMRHRWLDTIDTLLVKVVTDSGLVGYGESKAVVGGLAVKAYVDGPLRDAMIGIDPIETRVVWDRLLTLMRGRGHVQGLHQEAAAGLDIACWDLAGKAFGQPVYTVLGGKYRQDVPVYYSGFAGLRDPLDVNAIERLQRAVVKAVSQGFTAGKIAIGFGRAADLASVQAVREVAGDSFTILVDSLGAYSYPDALWLAHAFSEANVAWFETPLPPEDVDGYVLLSQQVPIHIANDFFWTVALVKELVRRGARLVIQPEVIKVGITESRRLAELADVYNLPFAPHSSIGSAVQYVATSHLAAAVPNLLMSEHWASENPLGNPILTAPLALRNGALTPPDGHGLGIELDLDELARYSTAGAKSW